MQSYITPEMQAGYDEALFNVFATFMRPLTVYIDAQVAVVNTTASFAGMFGDSSQNAVGPGVTPVTPQSYVVSGCIHYANGQPWPYIAPPGPGQNKARESEGTVRLKVDVSGYALLNGCAQVRLDGYTFTNDSTPRPHGLVGQPNRWTFNLLRVDPS